MNKTIHYIWLGNKPKPNLVEKCIASWKKHMPDWEIKEWNETNLDLELCDFCKEAYDNKKYAFAADVLRFEILRKEGGMYFDTDVKMLKSLAPLTDKYEAFAGFEFKMVNPGLVLYSAEPDNEIITEMAEAYKKLHFLTENGLNLKAVGVYFSEILEKYGFAYEDKQQQCGSFTVLPSTYFCPIDGYGNPYNYSENTYTVHLFAGTWLPKRKKLVARIKKIFYKIFGLKNIQHVMSFLRKLKSLFNRS